VKDKAEALRLYAQQQRDEDLERYAAEIKTRAMRRIGELSADLETARGPNSKLPSGGKYKTEVLAEAGISTSTANRCEKLAAIPEDIFEENVAQGVTATNMIKPANVHVSNNSGENEWYTPAEFIEAARATMGSIDIDPASCELANQTVKADRFCTIDDSGLEATWTGNVWLNPPYAQPQIGDFAKKLVEESDNFKQAIVLVNNATETRWFQLMLFIANAVCFPSSRIKFIDKNGNPSGAPLQGQAILYFGENKEKFTEHFSGFGKILYAI
jgi:ParB family chromosome partitioning protein